MRERIAGLTDTVRQTLEDDSPFGLQEIYKKVRRKLRLTSEQIETTYRTPNFQHSIRAVLSYLVKEGEVIRVSKGRYRRKPCATS